MYLLVYSLPPSGIEAFCENWAAQESVGEEFAGSPLGARMQFRPGVPQQLATMLEHVALPGKVKHRSWRDAGGIRQSAP